MKEATTTLTRAAMEITNKYTAERKNGGVNRTSWKAKTLKPIVAKIKRICR